ncbi:MAG: BTAD domain-containing putative transcriptional regulator [Geminicoccaceae bacterium]
MDVPEFDVWLTIERRRIRQQVVAALERRIEADLRVQNLNSVVKAAETLLKIEPENESAHRALMKYHWLRGDSAAAIRQYEACHAVLAHYVETEPSEVTSSLLTEIRTKPNPRVFSPPAPAIAPVTTYAKVSIDCKVTDDDSTDQIVSEAIVNSLRESLIKIRWLTVVVETEKAGQQDPASYRIALSFMRAQHHVRLATNLVQNSTGRILWATHQDGRLGDDLFGFVDGIAAGVAVRLDHEIQMAEISRVARCPIESLSAYDHVLRAIPLIFKMDESALKQAGEHLRAAQEADSVEPLVYVWRAFWSFINLGEGYAADPKAAREEVTWLVRRALELDPRNALAHATAGHVASFIFHDYPQAFDRLDDALKLDPNSALAIDLSATTHAYTGKIDEGMALIRRTGNDHFYPFFFRTTAAIVYMLAGKFDEAIEASRQALHDNPNFHAAYRPLITSLGHMGLVEQAQRHLQDLHRNEPDFSISWFRENYPPLQEEHAEQYILGLRKAGVPE